MFIKIGYKKLKYEIKYKKIKHAYLKITPDYQLEIILPKNKSVKPEDLISEKQKWLIRKLKEIDSSIKLFGKDWIYYKGRKYKIKVIKDKNQRIRFYNDFVEVYKFGKKKTENLLKEFLADETLEYVLRKCEEFSAKINLLPKSVSIKNMKSFGHCTRDQRIFFNSKLICLPTRIIDYIICHEVMHLKYFNHSKKFKLSLAKFFPEYKKIEMQLKKYYW